MRRRLLLIGIILGGMSLLFTGCGTGPGSPGSKGSENTGAKIEITAVNHHDAGFGDQGDNWDIDAIQDMCDTDPEPFGNDYVTVTFKATPLGTTVTPGNLHLETYSVEFFPQDPGSPPVERLDGFNSLTIEPTGEEFDGNFLVVDVDRKTQLANDIQSGLYSPQRWPVIYDMRMTFKGQDDFGNDFEVIMQKTINFADYDNC